MVLNQKIIDYLTITNVSKTISSNFIISDLNQVIYNSNYDSKQNYNSSKLTSEITDLISKWNTCNPTEDNFFIINESSMKITENDCEKHSAIMVFPIYSTNKIEGLTICFRNFGDYINSSIKAPNTIRK